MTARYVVLVACLAFAGRATVAQAPEPGFSTLFNGKDLTGWVYGRRAGGAENKTGKGYQVENGGIYKDAVDQLCREMEVKPDYKEVTFANSTVGLRRGDYDLFGSSLTYTMARAVAVNYIGPLYSKGSLLLVHKDDAGRFKSAADLNSPDVTFSVVAGGSEEPRIPILFPKAKLITTAGQVVLGAEPVRAKRAQVWMSGDSDVLLFAKRNPSWAVVIEPDSPIDRRPNTWAIRYGDNEWKFFLDMFGSFLVANGEMNRLFKLHMEKLGAA